MGCVAPPVAQRDAFLFAVCAFDKAKVASRKIGYLNQASREYSWRRLATHVVSFPANGDPIADERDDILWARRDTPKHVFIQKRRLPRALPAATLDAEM
jgi:hypothetical protein